MASKNYYKIINHLNDKITKGKNFLRSGIEKFASDNNIKSSDVDKVINDITKIHYFDNGQQGRYADFGKEFKLLANVPYRICDGWKYKTLELEAANVSCISTQYGPLAELNRSNFNIVSNLISTSPSHQVNLTECVFNSFNSSSYNQKQFLLAMMRVIDIENSTNAWNVHDSREQIFKVVDWIVNNYSSFINKLQAGDKNLPDLLLTEPFNNPTTKIKSLVSKFCKYLNEYLWVNLPNTQRFFINDSFIRAMLPYYYKQYVNPGVLLNIGIVNNYSYVQLFDKLEEIRIAANKINNSNLSRSEMDQIIWYCYRKYEK